MREKAWQIIWPGAKTKGIIGTRHSLTLTWRVFSKGLLRSFKEVPVHNQRPSCQAARHQRIQVDSYHIRCQTIWWSAEDSWDSTDAENSNCSNWKGKDQSTSRHCGSNFYGFLKLLREEERLRENRDKRTPYSSNESLSNSTSRRGNFLCHYCKECFHYGG